MHLRDTLANLGSEVGNWRDYFAFYGDGNLPLWVTETGYPSDPAYQYDPAFRGTDTASGQAEQAAFLSKSLPTLLYAGASRVFVTERDNLTGQFASEGLIGGQVTEADELSPSPAPKPAYTTCHPAGSPGGGLAASAAACDLAAFASGPALPGATLATLHQPLAGRDPSDRHTPLTNDRHTPLTNDRHTPLTNHRQDPLTGGRKPARRRPLPVCAPPLPGENPASQPPAHPPPPPPSSLSCSHTHRPKPGPRARPRTRAALKRSLQGR